MRYFTAAFAVLLCVCALTALLPSCSVGGEYIAYTVARPDKFMDGTSSTARVALYVDPAAEDYRQILTDVGKYSIRQKGKVLPYFDYVILGGAAIKRGGGSLAKLVMSEQLQAVLNERDTLLRPLRWRGIKILLGVTGGRDGITFASVVTEADQLELVQQTMDICKYYELEGIEFNDRDGESSEQTPYPEIGKTFFSGEYINGKLLHEVSDESMYDEFWTRGGGYMVNLMSRILQAFSDTNTFQGDPNMERVKDFPILVQEVNFGIKLPENVPRYAFESSSSCFTYSINDDKTAFSDESTLNWVRSRAYAPQQIDLKTVSSEELEEYSKAFVEGLYGLVYYYNMQPHSEEQLDNFSITSGEVFLTNVRWGGK